MRISDWSSDVCSSDLRLVAVGQHELESALQRRPLDGVEARRERIEKDRCGNRADEAAALPVARRRRDLGAAQAGGGGEIIVAPRPRLRLIAELVIGRGKRRARVLLIWLAQTQLHQNIVPTASLPG